MRKYLLPNAVTIFLSAALFISGCQFQFLPPPSSVSSTDAAVEQKGRKTTTGKAEIVAQREDEAADGKEVDSMALAAPTKPARRATISKEERAINAIIKAVEAPVETLAEEPAEEPTEEPRQLTLVAESIQTTFAQAMPTSMPTPVPPTATPAPPFVYITGAPIHIRTGPSDQYGLRGIADAGATLALVGQANNCQWYQVQHTDFGTAWLSGSTGNVTIYNATCSQIPATN